MSGLSRRQARRPAVVALHYQNGNCHPDGKIRVGIADDSATRGQ
ncbi:MAG: hypothetical protein P1U37_07600 [Minwuia sp.]|nr:hypothetical protein [Minwuia sp.]